MSRRETIEVALWSLLPLVLLGLEGVAFGLFGEEAQRWLVGGVIDHVRSVMAEVAARRGV